MPIKIMIVDDAVLYRKLFSEIASSFPEVEVTGTAPSGDIALKKMVRTPVDLVLCDIYMPEKDGVETLIEIKKRFPEVVVVMMSGISTRNADITIRALELGALEFISKPETGTSQENLARLRKDFEWILRLVNIRLQTRRSGVTVVEPSAGIPAAPKPLSAGPRTTSPVIPAHFSILAIGVSTGGPEALGKLIPSLPGNLPLPVLLVQHMPPGFTKSLAESLAKKSALRIVEAEDGQPIVPGTVFIAPGGSHMIVRESEGGTLIGLSDGPPENSCKPSVDVLFRSIAHVYRDRGILSLILTGMGNDGLGGVRTMKKHGCFCITQAAASCVVYGMPRAIDDAGLSNMSLPLEEIPGEIRNRLGQKSL